MTTPCEILPITEPDALEAVVDLEVAVWGMAPRDAVPMSLMRPIALHGGIALGAYHDERLVGAALALPLRFGRRWVLWSHLTGVHPDFQSHGIGFELKQAQRTWALENGYSEIHWTFDPLQRGNANFNMNSLGATADTYHVGYYGIMDDAINRGGVSDRIEASWKLKSPRVKALAQRKRVPHKTDPREVGKRVLVPDDHGDPLLVDSGEPNTPVRLVAIPRDRSALSTASLGKWSLAVREALRESFARGYAIVDFIDDRDCGWYVLEAPPAWYLYVLRCADNSLYTGITPDLGARLARHQSGKGAAYTATRRPVEMIGAWKFTGRSQALKAELAFKQQTRANKLGRVLRREPYHGADFLEPSVTA